MEPNIELSHHGVKGMKWGVRRKRHDASNSEKRKGTAEKTSNTLDRYKKKLGKLAGSEMSKRGKAAIDVLKNGDSDWMGNPINSDNVGTEIRNRGKAAVERLLYSEDQIYNKKFFGRYNF